MDRGSCRDSAPPEPTPLPPRGRYPSPAPEPRIADARYEGTITMWIRSNTDIDDIARVGEKAFFRPLKAGSQTRVRTGNPRLKAVGYGPYAAYGGGDVREADGRD